MNAAEARETQERLSHFVKSEFRYTVNSQARLLQTIDALIADDREARELLAWAMERLKSQNQDAFIAAALAGRETEYTRNWARARALLEEP